MMIFNATKAFVWIWLPNAEKPVIAGSLEKNGEVHDFFFLEMPL